MSKKYYYLIIFSLVILIAQLLTGTLILTAFLFSTAIFFGLCAVYASGSWNSMFGLLNLSLLVKFLLFGVILKTIFLQPSDSPLLAPVQTAMVSALGFAGVLIGTLLARKLPTQRKRLIYTINSKEFYLSLYILLFVVGYGFWLYVRITRQGIYDLESGVGGVFGVFGQFGEFKELSITAAIYYAWVSKSKRFLSHPLVIFTLVVSIIIGFYSTSKQGIVEPLLYLTITVLSLKSFRYRPLWIILVLLPIFYIGIVYPYSNYGRYVVEAQDTTADKITTASQVLTKIILDDEYRSIVNQSLYQDSRKQAVSAEPYLPVAGDTLNRFAMVSEADRLIATSIHSEPSGWKTISWGFNMILPRFINPDKPIFAANNYLAHVVGELSPRDSKTQVSYGFMANFYYAFGLVGVFVGSILLISSLYYWLTLFFGNTTDLNIWGIFVFGEFQHVLTEQAVSGVIASCWFPINALLMFLIAKTIFKAIS